jgi:hypothetical protein
MNELKKQKRASVPAKTSAVAGVASTLLSFGAYYLHTTYGVPPEVTAPLVGAAMAWIGHWAGAKDPNVKP